jgi:hypothetical protein
MSFKCISKIQNGGKSIMADLETNVFLVRRESYEHHFRTLGQGWATGSPWATKASDQFPWENNNFL